MPKTKENPTVTITLMGYDLTLGLDFADALTPMAAARFEDLRIMHANYALGDVEFAIRLGILLTTHKEFPATKRLNYTSVAGKLDRFDRDTIADLGNAGATLINWLAELAPNPDADGEGGGLGN